MAKPVSKIQSLTVKTDETLSEVGMIAFFMAGVLVGLFLSWLKLRKMARELRTSTEALSEATFQQTALSARLKAANAALAMLTPQNKVDEEDIAA